MEAGESDTWVGLDSEFFLWESAESMALMVPSQIIGLDGFRAAVLGGIW